MDTLVGALARSIIGPFHARQPLWTSIAVLCQYCSSSWIFISSYNETKSPPLYPSALHPNVLNTPEALIIGIFRVLMCQGRVQADGE